MATYLNDTIEIKCGDTFHLEFWWTDENGTKIDMTGCTALMQLRPTPKSDSVLDLTTENGRITLSTGVISLDIDASDTQLLEAQRGVFDLQLTYSDGVVKTLCSGRYRVLEDLAFIVDDSN